MRLQILEKNQRKRARLVLSVMRLLTRMEPDAVARAALYRPAFFGRHFLRLVEHVMQGPSEWSRGERELLASLVSSLNSCPFCTRVHGAMARLRFDPRIEPGTMRDWRDRDLAPHLRAGMQLAETITVSRGQLTTNDVLQARAAGLSKAMIADVIHIAFVFNMINRVANAFGFDWDNDTHAARGASLLNLMKYRVPGFFVA